MFKVYNTQEQQIEKLEEILQVFVDYGPKPIAKIDLERLAQLYVDEYDDDLLLSAQEVAEPVEDVWDKYLKKTAIFNETIAESTKETIQHVNDAVGRIFRQAVEESLDDFNITQNNLTEELADNIDEVLVKIACDLEVKFGADVYRKVSDDITNVLQHTELNI